MTKTKEEIKNKIAGNNNFDSFERAIRYTFNRELLYSEKEFIDKLIDEAMQEYSDQENARLKAVVSKQDELIEHVKMRPIGCSKSWQDKNKQLESELSKLKAE